MDAEVTTINTLADGTIYLGDTNGDAQEVTMNGDVTIDNAGATTIATGAVTDTKLDKTNIPLSGFAAAAADVDLGANKLTDVADPTAAQDAATKAYVDAEITNGTATNVSGTVAVVNGGTGATTAALARNNLGIYTGIATKPIGGAGTLVTVINSNVLTTSKIMITILNDPGNAAIFYIGTIIDNTSFVIISREGNFNITNISYLIIN